jgi:hypothetical protein
VATSTKKKKTKAPKKSGTAVALHLQKKSTHEHAVGIGNIRVILFKEDGVWIAQGLEIDYAASGSTRKEAQKNFEIGLEGTVDLHIKIHKGIDNLLKVAPEDIWKSLYQKGTEYRFTQITFHDDLFKALPFTGIDYLEPVETAA